MNTLLISIEDIREFKQISANTDVNSKVKFQIREAQEFDLRGLLGDDFYHDFVSKFDAQFQGSTNYQTLFEGGTYEYNNKTYSFAGIRAVLVYYTYARIIQDIDINVGAHGMTRKIDEYSERPAEKEISRKVGQAVSGAQVYAQQLVEYLNRKQSDFSLWKGTNQNVKTGSFKISAIGGNKKRLGGTQPCNKCGRYSYCNC
jgi:hypothetical protein